MMEIKYCMLTAGFNCNETRHPQKVMRGLGIKYESSRPESLFDCWIFNGCTNVPKNPPEYLKFKEI